MPSDHDYLEHVAAQHAAVEPMLSAYADGELLPGQATRVQAHLAGCARCRRQLELTAAVDERMAREPLERASPALRARVLATTRALPGTATIVPPPVDCTAAAVSDGQVVARGPWRSTWERRIAWSGWLAAAGLAGLLLTRAPSAPATLPPEASASTRAASAEQVPMVAAALSDFRRVIDGRALPGRAEDLAMVRAAVPFPVTPVGTPGIELIAAWTTTIRGEPAAALAYRWRDRVVVQYVVSEPLFRRHPEVQQAVAAHGVFTSTAGPDAVVAWPGDRSGSLLVGATSPDELLRARAGAAL